MRVGVIVVIEAGWVVDADGNYCLEGQSDKLRRAVFFVTAGGASALALTAGSCGITAVI